jgi:hypothetical protein
MLDSHWVSAYNRLKARFVGTASMGFSQQRAPRYSFPGSAEVVRAHSVAITEITQLSRYGCYLAAISSLPRRTVVTVRIKWRENGLRRRLQCCTQPLLGMGLAFRNVKPPFCAVLQEWLQHAAGQQNVEE